ncbi:hypothetical protein CDIK_1599 [Cucumispora dikerogammari]|nr:hypothetical protein CDIK_1599 [Cucumispora dikerogammari]
MFAILKNISIIYSNSASFNIKRKPANIVTTDIVSATSVSSEALKDLAFYDLDYLYERNNIYIESKIYIGPFGDDIELIDSLIMFVIYVKKPGVENYCLKKEYSDDNKEGKYTFKTNKYFLKEQDKTVFGISQKISINTVDKETNKKISWSKQNSLYKSLFWIKKAEDGKVAYRFEATFTIKDKITNRQTKIVAKTVLYELYYD